MGFISREIPGPAQSFGRVRAGRLGTMVAQNLVGSRLSEEKRVITLQEVALHDAPDDCWIVLHNKVYEITHFLALHPGGMEVLFEYGGRDGTLAYQEAGHTPTGLLAMDRFMIGVLPESERLQTKGWFFF